MAPPASVPPNRDGLPDRRTFLVGAVLFVLTAVPTAVGMAAGSSFLTTASQPAPRLPGATRSPDGPLVIDRRADPAAPAGPPLPAITPPDGSPPAPALDSDPPDLGGSGGAGGGSGTPMARSRGVRSRVAPPHAPLPATVRPSAEPPLVLPPSALPPSVLPPSVLPPSVLPPSDPPARPSQPVPPTYSPRPGPSHSIPPRVGPSHSGPLHPGPSHPGPSHLGPSCGAADLGRHGLPLRSSLERHIGGRLPLRSYLTHPPRT
jgi:hypothetical protein